MGRDLVMNEEDSGLLTMFRGNDSIFDGRRRLRRCQRGCGGIFAD